MKVFVAGATGAVGRKLVPALVKQGHEVVGMTRSPEKEDVVREMGAEPAIANGLDATAVRLAIEGAEPEAIIHQMTALANAKSLRRFDKDFAGANELRTTGLDNLLEAARAVGTKRFIAQSYGNWNYERSGSELKTEEDPLDPNPPANQTKTLEAIRYLEDAVTGAEDLEGIAMRYGNFYGPGTGFATDGDLVEMVRKRKLPVVGDGAGVWSFAHVHDVAAITAAALKRGKRGIYNACDDAPSPVAEWLPGLAEAVGARQPRHVPTWVARLATGEVGVSMMTRIRGASNAKAKRELDWAPIYPSWREGFRSGL